MGANRFMGQVAGLAQPLGAGSVPVSTAVIKIVAADAAHTITVSEIASGVLQFTGLTAGRNLTVPLGADLTAAFPEVGVGESLKMVVSITTGFALTLVTATGNTLAGRATIPASETKEVYFTRTGEATWVTTVL